jgi:hypothetical protein
MTDEKTDIGKQAENDFLVKDFIHQEKIKIGDNEYTVGFKEISGYDDDAIKTKTMQYHPKTGDFSIKHEDANMQMLLESIVEFPLPITEATFKRLSKKVKDQLVELAKKVNTIDEETEKK